jgi:hydrogenase expression/formation protein HypC
MPARIESVEGRAAVVSQGERRIAVDLSFVPEAGVGDWVVVHSGIAVRSLDPDEALEAVRLLEEAAAVTDAEATP